MAAERAGTRTAPIDPSRTYVVAATDFEFWSEAGLVEADWKLSVRYDFPTLVREAIEEQLANEALTPTCE
jgi:hypothetical protein